MRWFHIALFMLVFSLVAGYLCDKKSGFMGMMGFGDVQSIYSTEVTNAEIQKTADVKTKIGLNESSIGPVDPLAIAFGWFYTLIKNTIVYVMTKMPIIKYTFFIPLFLKWLGIPGVFADGVFAIYVVIESIGFAEWITGRDVER